ncbi:Oidioi.mRNA.OKI2018_I69.PAR.g13112.t1.cds [Oikopleura dioica]|uniref:Guanylate cyclase n=1 Tax=Oikopleura dioica TaxID=34765 RepID=A0ABN7SA17_OIKDI|nr:Oidioi.mRNA.OKI2018_I69.PAR.g13112.t1.cds [Oikopleura dioica]
MKYLHGSDVKLHGRLKSTNCVVDGRFTCKITDYGLPRLYDAQNMYDETAPELLKDEKLRRKGTQKGDVYAFAIIASEIVLRGEPFSNTGYSPKAIISRIRRPPPLLRPSIPTSLCPYQVKSMIKECWDEEPERRLTFSQICDALSKVQKGKKTNIVDNMMKMLEEYSNHLEDIVKARTAELEVEKKKSQELLARMMPVEIAQRLQNGETVLPVCYDETTIYFSDICGFTSISAASTPFEVVDLLNDLYTLFDNIIDEYEVYKVETIGDAYMVSSGVPFKIGDRHAPEICMLAMDILSATGSFIMRHMPEVPMKIRIGLHSGPAVAGVVGLAMPRYCLFGDTINTASRMESNGLPSRIHISWSTRECLLKSDEGFQIQERGTVELKGKGVLTTYWLAGKEGYDSHGIKLDEYMNGNRPPPPKEPIKQKPFIPSKRKAVKKGWA